MNVGRIGHFMFLLYSCLDDAFRSRRGYNLGEYQGGGISTRCNLTYVPPFAVLTDGNRLLFDCGVATIEAGAFQDLSALIDL